LPNLQRRKLFSTTMLALTSLCALLAFTALVIILGYIVVGGLRALSWDFLVNTPKPIGEPHSGIANAIVGSLVLVGLGSVIGMPVGILAGIYLAEFGQNKFGYGLRFFIDTLIGVPSIVIGVFVWTVMVRPMGHFSAWAGGAALAIMMMPIVARTTEEMIRLVPQSLREAALALGAPVW
jgi:phosphate transport system permease protein